MKIAVVIPTYNRADMVCEAVDSALGQTARGQVIVVDDGSTDDTLARLSAYGDAITVVAQENAERGAARNAGAALAADADLLLFLDADDVIGPGHLEALARLAEAHPEATLVATPSLLVDRDLKPFQNYGQSRSGPVTLESFLMGRESLPPPATAVRREVFDSLGGFSERRDLSGSEDWLLMAHALTHAPGHRGGEPTAFIRRHEGNTMANAGSMRESMLLAHRLFFDDVWPHVEGRPEARGLSPGIRESSKAHLLINAATGFYGIGEMRAARSTLWEALRTDPRVLTSSMLHWTWMRSLLGGRLSSALRAWKRRRGLPSVAHDD